MPQASSLLPGMRNLSPDAKKLGASDVKPSWKTLSRILKYAGNQKRYVVYVMTAAVIGCTFDVFAPYFMGRMIDMMTGKGSVRFDSILKAGGVLLSFYLMSAGLQWILNYFSNLTAVRTAAELRREGFERISRMPLSFFDRTSHGDIDSRFVNDIDAISDGLLQGMVQLFSGSVTIVGTLAFMFILSWKMTLIVLPSAALSFLLASFIVRITGKYFRRQQAHIGELNGIVEEIFSGEREVKAFGYQDRAMENFEAVNQKLQKVGQKAQFASSLPNPTTRFVNNLAYILIGVFGWLAGGLSIGSISSFLQYWNQFSRPLNDLTNITTQIMAAFASAQRVFEVLDMPEEKEDPADAVSLDLQTVRGEVEFSHVDFSYRPDHPLIRDFSVTVKPGQKIAIVGPTGAGKTTMINLLMRFYEPGSGAIRVDGIDTSKITRKSLRRSFGMVLQDTWLFAGTILENLTYGKPSATLDEVKAACRAVHAHSFIRQLPNGYDTVISEDGGSLSQGQKQLLTIARALIADPRILILDEATSSVDTLTEIRIQEAFALLMKNRTSFVIAHRLSTIREADLILVMEGGRIIEQGTHASLLAAEGFYYTLYNSQFQSA
jgi:ATP-binding cassette, subfamily B, multidrug efflux pump